MDATVADQVAVPPPPAAPPERAEISFASANPAMVVLSYLWIFCIVPLLAEPNDRAVRWHAVHGLVLVIAESVGSLAVLFLGMIVDPVLPAPLGALFALFRSLLWPAVLVLHAILMVDGVRGRGWRLPWITPYAERILGHRWQVAAP